MGDEEEPVITLDDFIQEEEDSSARVFGGLDRSTIDKCSYSLGYIPRQSLYFCKTCYQTTQKRAGICFACSEVCHDGHEIVELFTKRNFRCDCGNDKFSGASPCQLYEDKDLENAQNKYDHNFEGLYCTCNRPYPDPEYVGTEVMEQCIVCEDWFHLEHIGVTKDTIAADSHEEMICNQCVKKHPFLWLFYYSQNKLALKENEEQEDVEEPAAKRSRADESEGTKESEICRVPAVLSSCGVDKLDVSTEEISKLEVNGYKFPSPIFWENDWRSETLCSCDSCKNMLKERGIDFILDVKDTLAEYMEKGRTKVSTYMREDNEESSRSLLQMPRDVAIEIAHSINHFKQSLGEFLARESQKGVITTEAVTRWYEDLLSSRGDTR